MVSGKICPIGGTWRFRKVKRLYGIKKTKLPFILLHLNQVSIRGKPMPCHMKSNPILMCVNKDLLDKEGIEVPKEGWSLKSSIQFAKN